MKQKYENELVFYKKNEKDKKLKVINENDIYNELPDKLKIKNVQSENIQYINLSEYEHVKKIETKEPILNEIGQINLTIKWIKGDDERIITGHSFLGVYSEENFNRMLKEALYQAFSQAGGYPDIWIPLNITFYYIIKK